MKVFIKTLGCEKNTVDSENALALLEEIGKVPEWKDAQWLLRYQMTAMEETFKRLL